MPGPQRRAAGPAIEALDPRTHAVYPDREDPFSTPDFLHQLLDTVTDPANMSPTGLLGAGVTGLGKAVKLSEEDLGLLHELLGKPIQLGKRLIRLSSVNPAKNTAILHDATTGERVASPIPALLKAWRTIGEDTATQFPEGSVLSQPGVRAQGGTIGPRGGLLPQKRMIPPTATR